MKNKFLLIILTLLFTKGYSQEIKTIFNKDTTKTRTYGGFGAPIFGTTYINRNWGEIAGGKGGIIINRKFAIGGIGIGTSSNQVIIGDNLKGNTNSELVFNMGSGGLFFEYILNIEKPVHFSFPINFMSGGASVKEKNNDKKVESSQIYIIEPGVSVEFNVMKFFIPSLSLSYRQVFKTNLVNITNDNLSGVNIALSLKFGSF